MYGLTDPLVRHGYAESKQHDGTGAATRGGCCHAAALPPHTREEAWAAVYRSNARPRCTWRQGQCKLLIKMMYHHFLDSARAKMLRQL
jgi:hypothetical protein